MIVIELITADFKLEKESFTFKIKQSTKLAKLFDDFCTKFKIPREKVRFSFKGQTLEDDSTPGSLKL